MSKVLIICGIVLVGWSWALAQPATSINLGIMLEVADDAYEIADYVNAIEWYKRAYKEDPDVETAWRIAQANESIRDYKGAQSWYNRVARRDKTDQYPNAFFLYAKNLLFSGETATAIDLLNEILVSAEDEDIRTETISLLDQADRYDRSQEDVQLVVRSMDRRLSSRLTDASPAIDPDGTLYFASLKSKTAIEISDKKEIRSKIYRSTKQKNKWKTGKALPSFINTSDYEVSNVSLNEDGTVMYFTRAKLEEGELVSSTVFVVEKKGHGWGKPTTVTGLTDYPIVRHPAPGKINGDEVLFFVLKTKEHFGDDLYFARISEPHVLGKPQRIIGNINTAGNEVSPFYKDDVLYFSSTGHSGYGGLDAFKSTWNGVEWGQPVNMGKGFNSIHDDWYLVMGSDNRSGYFVSNRPNRISAESPTCCDKMYEFAYSEVQVELITTIRNGAEPVTGSEVKFIKNPHLDLPDNESISSLKGHKAKFKLTPETKYIMIVSHPDFVTDTFEFSTVDILENTRLERTFDLEPRPVKVAEVELYDTLTINEPIRLNNIYYDYDDHQLLDDAETDLNVLYDLMRKYSDMVIELSSHTDARGGDEYNQRLSQRRAESATKYLIGRGIAADRIQAVGYGETVILNRCINGVECSDDDHRLNRRTEFKILSGPKTIQISKKILKKRN